MRVEDQVGVGAAIAGAGGGALAGPVHPETSRRQVYLALDDNAAAGMAKRVQIQRATKLIGPVRGHARATISLLLRRCDERDHVADTRRGVTELRDRVHRNKQRHHAARACNNR